ncbi:ninjurin-2 isoform X1 [Brachionus plicatilis]|uniref:Ninjurin-2 isoform X1 n=1 Tax=Brachionus plicatilis TaxID=10195 RepID=A0A3M7S8W8_BRAPC|nr:ninjurin-2 isoform X1 [Brachionus plicatilis]
MSDQDRENATTPMMTPTTEYQTEKEEAYRATDCSDKKLKLKNPLKMPVALLPPDRNQPPMVLDPNIYSTKKTVMTILCLIIIIMANSIQLKYVIKNSVAITQQFYSAQVGLGITSVLLAASIGFVLMYSARLNYNDEYKQRKIDFINNTVMILLFVLCILNIFIVYF